MFVCGYHFPASEGNDVSFDKVIAKVEEGLDAAGKSVIMTSETDMVNMIDRTKNSWTRPSLDLYLS